MGQTIEQRPIPSCLKKIVSNPKAYANKVYDEKQKQTMTQRNKVLNKLGIMDIINAENNKMVK